MTFHFSIGGYFGSSFVARIVNNELECREFTRESPDVEIEPAHIDISQNKEWDELISFLNNCNWTGHYEGKAVDGTQWKLVFRNGEKRIEASGSNEYPEDFQVFLDLLNKVTFNAGLVIH
jgi:hypothetical protein